MKTATFKKRLETCTGDASLYELSEPLKPYVIDENNSGYNYVVVSAATTYIGPETYIFGADENGNILDCAPGTELPGSTRGIYCHEIALKNAGYEKILYNQRNENLKYLENKIQQYTPK